MADYNKTIDIEVKADMKQLLAEFKRMPGISAKEAKKMVSELGKNYKAAATEAKKAANKQKAAMDKMNAANKKVVKSAKNVRTQSREMGAAFGSLEDVVGGLNPELAGAAAAVGTLGQAFRSFSRSLATGNVYVTGLVIGLAALAAAYTIWTTATREAEQRQKDLSEAAKSLNEKLETQRNLANQVVTAHRNATLELEVFTGQITKLDANILKARDSATEQLNKQLKTQDKIIEEQEKNLSLVNKAETSYKSLTDEESEQLRLLVHASKIREVNVGLGSTQAGREAQLNILQDELNKQLAKEQAFRTKIVKTNEETLDKRIELLELQNELKKEQEEEARRLDAQAKKEAERKAKEAKQQAELDKAEAEAKRKAAEEEQRLEKLTQEIQKTGAEARKNSENISLQNKRSLISLIKDETDRITETAKLDKEIISDKIASLEEQKELNISLAETEGLLLEAKKSNAALDIEIDELKQQSHIREMRFSAERSKALDNEKKKRLSLINAMVQQSSQGADAVSTIIKNVTGENKEAAKIAFRVNQAAALSNIIMTTASKVMEVAPNPFAIAAVAGLGALQAGVVLTQSPPEFHMGGVIAKGEDTRNITVLTGEAVLDRRTVDRIGGTAGVAALQRGEMPSPEIIVMNPFKHFDRYAMASSKRGGVMKNFSNTQASGGY